MKFERIVLRNFRAIREYRFDLPPQGVVVIEGENELGKSSIAEALWMVFEYPDSSESDRVRSVKPIDRDVGSEIEVTVSTGPYRFTYIKRFHRNPQTLLRIESPRREDRTGREAHERVLQILDETTDRALWEALRLLQGDALSEVAVAGNLSIAAALDDAATTSLGSQREQSLFERAEAEYLRYFTRTGRENKDFLARRDAVARYQADATRIEQQLTDLEAMAERCMGLEAEISSLRTRSMAAEAVLTELQERSSLRAGAMSQLRNAQTDLTLAQARLDQLRQQAERREEARREIAALEERISAAEGPLSEARARLEVFEHALKEAETALNAGRTELERVGAAVEVAQADYSYMHEQFQLQQMSERLERVRASQASLREVTAFLNACHINPRILSELEDAERSIAVETARLEAEVARITVRSDTAAELLVDGESLAVGPAPVELPVTGETTLVVAGVEVHVSAGSAATAVRERLDQAVARLADRCREVGVGSLAEARELERKRLDSVNELRHLEAQLRADLGDLSSAEELEAKIERDRQRGLRHLANRSAIAPLPASLQEARDRTNIAREAETAARNRVTPLENAVRAAQNGAVAATERARTLERDRDADQARLDRNREWLAVQEATQTLAALSAELDHAESAVAAARAELASAEAALEALPDVSSEMEETAARVAAARQELRAAEDELNRITGALAHAGESGLLQRRDAALSLRSEAEGELDAFSQRADAARMLFETLRRHREQAKRSYARPLEDRLNELGRKVFNPTFAVELDAELRIARRTLDGTTLDFRHLSGGAKEQLGILMRLACASLVSATGGVPLILDDVLGWTDPARARRLGQVLASAGSGVQVIILTCTPDRFASVVPATIISLPSGRSRTVTGEEPPTLDAPGARPTTPPRRQSALPPTPAGVRQAGFELFDTDPAPRN